MSEKLHTAPESQESELRYSHAETDYDTIRAVELQEIIDNPENVGFNFTNQHIVSPAIKSALSEVGERIESTKDDPIELAKLANELGLGSTQELLSRYENARQVEDAKIENMASMMDQIPDGASFRVHPFAPQSPFSLDHFRPGLESGEPSLDEDAIAQIAAMYEKSRSGDNPGELSVVLNSYTEERGGNTPESPEEIQAYADMCISFLEQLGLRETDGAGLCIELGNETNVDRHTQNFDGSLMFDKVDFADHADPIKYAHMYAKVASAIKARFPNVEVAIAGTAMFDEGYLNAVITEVLAESGGNKGLIDKISFHPYRTTLEEGATTFVDGKRISSDLNYDEQLDRMAALAAITDARFDVGEVSFSNEHGVSVDTIELHKNSAHAREHGLKSYTWPEDEILTYENPNN